MRKGTVLSLFFAVVLAGVAVLAMREFLNQQLAQNSSDQSSDKKPITTIVVASESLRFGKLIELQSLKTLEWPSENIPKGAFRTVDELIDPEGKPRYVMSAFETNEPIIASKITGAGQRATLSAILTEGMKAVSIRVNDVLGVSGFVLPGDRVDVMLTHGRRGSDRVKTDVLLQGLRVLAIDQTADDREDKPSVVKTITFEVSTREAQKLTLAASVGTLSLALRNIASAGVEDVDAIDVNDLGGGPVSEVLQQERLTEGDVEKLVTEEVAKLRDEVTQVQSRPIDVSPRKKRTSFTSIGVYRNSGQKTDYKVKKQNEIDEEVVVDNNNRIVRTVR